jgi:plastocyanin
MTGSLKRCVMVAGALALVALPAASAVGGVPVTKKVLVGDDYYGPTKLTVKKNTTVKWTWIADNTNSHDVKLGTGPTGVKKFHSASAASDYTFSEKLKVAGTYKIVCTLHQDMKMTITVK